MQSPHGQPCQDPRAVGHCNPVMLCYNILMNQHKQKKGMTLRLANTPKVRLLLLGAGPRLAGAALVVLALCVGYFWATSTPGGL